MSSKRDRTDAINAATDKVEAARRQLDATIAAQAATVKAARNAGDGSWRATLDIVSWTEIGQAAGISRQAAEKKWRHLNPGRARANNW